MDRPEDVQPNAVNGRVYVILTNNTNRKPDDVERGKPARRTTAFGHIIEIIPPEGDHAAEMFAWEILVRCGDPAVEAVGALWNPDTSSNGWFACPDNAAVDNQGRLWISTDQGDNWPRTGRSDGLFAIETDGARRRTSNSSSAARSGQNCAAPASP